MQSFFFIVKLSLFRVENPIENNFELLSLDLAASGRKFKFTEYIRHRLSFKQFLIQIPIVFFYRRQNLFFIFDWLRAPHFTTHEANIYQVATQHSDETNSRMKWFAKTQNISGIFLQPRVTPVLLTVGSRDLTRQSDQTTVPSSQSNINLPNCSQRFQSWSGLPPLTAAFTGYFFNICLTSRKIVILPSRKIWGRFRLENVDFLNQGNLYDWER